MAINDYMEHAWTYVSRPFAVLGFCFQSNLCFKILNCNFLLSQLQITVILLLPFPLNPENPSLFFSIARNSFYRRSRHLTTIAWRVGNLTHETLLGWGIWPLSGSGRENWNGSSKLSNETFYRAPKSLTAVNTCLDEMEEFQGRDTAIS